jgi:phage shock protein A
VWGYHTRVTDEALRRLSYALTERDTRIAILEQQAAELRQKLESLEAADGAARASSGSSGSSASSASSASSGSSASWQRPVERDATWMPQAADDESRSGSGSGLDGRE